MWSTERLDTQVFGFFPIQIMFILIANNFGFLGTSKSVSCPPVSSGLLRTHSVEIYQLFG